MRLNRRLLINLVTVMLLGALMVGWVVTQIVGGGIFSRPMKVTVGLAASGGVFTNQEVTYRGVLIGQVGSMTLSEDGVDVELLIDRAWENKIPADLIANVQSKSAVGEQFVNLTPQSSGGPTLADGDEIARANTRLPVDFQELLRTLDNVLADVEPGKTRRVIQTLSEGLGGRGGDIASIIESLGTLSDSFASVAPEQQRLLSNSTRTGTEFLRTKENFSNAIRAADTVLESLSDPDEIRALLAANDRLATVGLNFLQRNEGKLARGIHELRRFVQFQLAESDEIVKGLNYGPAFLHAVEDASVPWRSPDGHEFYRLRVGLIYDNVRESWPCKYALRHGYERFPHERDERPVTVPARCRPPTPEGAALGSLLEALEVWADENPFDLDIDAGPIPAPVDGFIWPHSGPVTSYFGMRGGRMHTGIDIDGATGDRIVASAAGRVVLARSYSGYGNTVIVDHGEGVSTLYAHLSAIAVQEGDEIAQGQTVGLMGCTGACTGDHLHFEVRVGGTPVDPMPYLPGGSLIGAGAPPQDPGAPPPSPSPTPSQPSPPASPKPSPKPSPTGGGNGDTITGGTGLPAN